MSMVKYRIHEVAKDFNVGSKVISQIMTDYVETPKNHMQVLETNELDIIFEYMTQHNQVDNLQDIFNVAAKKEEKPAEAKPTEPKKFEGYKKGWAKPKKKTPSKGKGRKHG